MRASAARALAGALAYALLAWPTTWLAPGLAAPFSPAAGLAVVLAARLRHEGLAGVLLGALAVSLLGSDGPWLALPLALAAGLHAWLAWRWSGELLERPLPDGWRIARLFALAGPLACVVSASVAVLALLLAGRIPLAGALGSWFARWAGDVIGVWTVLPIALAWLGPARAWRGRRLAVTAPMVLAGLALAAGHVAVQSRERQRSETTFRTAAYAVESTLTAELLRQEEAIRGLARALEGRGTPSPSRFAHLARPIVERLDSLAAVAWAPRLARDEVREVLAVMSRRLGRRLVLRQFEGAQQREHVHPVLYIEPPTAHEGALGLDLASEPARREVLHTASTWQGSALSAAIRLVQGEVGVLWATPVIEGDEVRAHVLGVIVVERLVDLTSRALPPGMALRMSDAGLDQQLATRAAWPEDPPFVALSTIPLGHRTWRLELAPTPTWPLHQGTPTATIVHVGGLALSGLLGGMLLLLTAQASTTQRLAEDLRRRNQDLELSNEELDRFVFLASHDLKAPARALRRLAGFLVEDVESEDEDVRANLQLMQARAARLERMLEDLLDYARAGRGEREDEEVELEELLARILTDLRPPRGARVELAGEVGSVRTARVPLERILANLVANAIQHHPSPETARVVVRATRSAEGLEVAVEDDGAGIAARDRPRALLIFQTLKARDRVESSGVGLALVKRIVERAGGRLQLDQSALGGLAVRFTWPSATPPSSRA